MSHRATIAVIRGDGIGPEVIDAALPVLEAAARADGLSLAWKHLPFGADHYLATGVTLPEHTVAQCETEVDAILLGALGDPRVPDDRHARDILFGLRFGLDLFVNFRPARLHAPELSPLKIVRHEGEIDLAIFRENTEGVYLGRGRGQHVGTDSEEQIVEEVNTAPKITRLLRAGFAFARERAHPRVTLCDKSNAIPGHRLWRRLFEEVGAEFPEIEREARYVDALAMELVREPQRFRVIVTNNLFGDILSDLAAQLVGGLGVAPSANIGSHPLALFEPVHGSAPSLAGKGVANPVAAILSGALMLEHLGAREAAARLEAAAGAVLRGPVRTPDLGGSATTAEVAEEIARRL